MPAPSSTTSARRPQPQRAQHLEIGRRIDLGLGVVAPDVLDLQVLGPCVSQLVQPPPLHRAEFAPFVRSNRPLRAGCYGQNGSPQRRRELVGVARHSPAEVAARMAWTTARATTSAAAAMIVASWAKRATAGRMNRSGDASGTSRAPDGQREHDVAVGVGVDRADRPGHPVVAGAGDPRALGLGQSASVATTASVVLRDRGGQAQRPERRSSAARGRRSSANSPGRP